MGGDAGTEVDTAATTTIIGGRQQAKDFARLFDDNRLVTDGAQHVCVARGEEGIAQQSFGVGRREWWLEGIGPSLIVRRGAWVEHDIFVGLAVRKALDFGGRLRRCVGRGMLAEALGDR